jgi:hypothetical protein
MILRGEVAPAAPGAGEPHDQTAEHTRTAMLYAMGAATGTVLWSGGDTITGFSHFSGQTLAALRR